MAAAVRASRASRCSGVSRGSPGLMLRPPPYALEMSAGRRNTPHVVTLGRYVTPPPPALGAAAPSRAAAPAAAPPQRLTLDQVTPPVAPAGPLPPSEEATVALFEASTYSVVNVFDLTLRPQVSAAGQVEVPEGNGSGFVWDEDGYVVTNYHVIGSSLARGLTPGKPVARVTILTSDGLRKNFEGTLVGADRAKDLAVLQVQVPPGLLRKLPVGSSSSLRVGQRCLAIGNPFGFDHTLTTGIVSGLNRDIYSQTGVVIGGGVQTDAAINPGNSGGPLLDSKGRLIGVNTAIFTRTGTSAGVGFAIPVDTVARIVPQLISYGKVIRPGLNVQFATDAVARQLSIQQGALVLSVPEGSAAAKAGLAPTRRGLAGNIVLGDILVGVDDTPIKSALEIPNKLDRCQVGDRVVLKVQRMGKQVELPVMLEESSR
eukprot:SM000031S11532  [mRNA]  locus=s31:127873:131993:- [translate_table: standard]